MKHLDDMSRTRPAWADDTTGWRGHFDEFAPAYEDAAFGGEGLRALGCSELTTVTTSLGEGGGRRLLDAGAGTGRFTRALSAADWAVTSLDLAPAMLGEACRSSEAVQAVVGRLGATLPFADASFDGVACVRVLKYVQDPTRALREFARVTRPGATVVLEWTNRRSAARFGYADAAVTLVSPSEVDAACRDVGLEPTVWVSGSRLPHPVWRKAHRRTPARVVRAVDFGLGRPGPRAGVTGARSFFTVCRRAAR